MVPSSRFCPEMYASAAERKICQRARIWRRFGWKFTVAYLSFEYFSCLLNYTLIHISNRRWVQGLHMLSVESIDFYGGNRRISRFSVFAEASKSEGRDWWQFWLRFSVFIFHSLKKMSQPDFSLKFLDILRNQPQKSQNLTSSVDLRSSAPEMSNDTSQTQLTAPLFKIACFESHKRRGNVMFIANRQEDINFTWHNERRLESPEETFNLKPMTS